jgi:glyoxylase I family protein
MGDFRSKRLAPGVALVTYSIRREDSQPVHTLRSSIWQLRDGRWQLVFHQGTRTSTSA